MDFEEKIAKTKKVWREAVKKFGAGSIGVGFTGRKDSSVMVHILLDLADEEGWKELPTFFFIDHGAHFKEVLEHLGKLEKEWGIEVKRIKDEVLIEKYKKERNRLKKRELLWGMKIALLAKTIKDNGWKGMASSVRRDENPARAGEEYFSARKGHTRIHPMLEWTEEDIWRYIRENNIAYNKMYDEGYRSIGEREFTKKSKGNERGGRDQVKEQVMKELRSMGYF